MNLPPLPERPPNRLEPALELEEERETAWITELRLWERGEERFPELLRGLSRLEGATGETGDRRSGSPSTNPLSRREPPTPQADIVAFPPHPFVASTELVQSPTGQRPQ
ncbi:hypothetical protein GCM10022254_33080 [Actinomadura meridiana]|uniref:Uncharacterized protein n=1 Tax=Actinomadura meridiana TaxID=559626 RepID=A0ABP8C2M1_9ACTN